MATAAPRPTPATAPKAPPATAPAPPTRPRVGELHDSGTVRKEFVNADRWFATGLVKVTGDVQVGQGKLDGTVTLGGKLAASDLQYRGTLDILGAVDVTAGYRAPVRCGRKVPSTPGPPSSRERRSWPVRSPWTRA